jgi:Holliday junction resolvase RusA-like endonuclease
MPCSARRSDGFTAKIPGGTIVRLDPVPKPRQTRRDRFNPSDRVQRYRTYADLLRYHLHNARINIQQKVEAEQTLSLTFVISMPESWSAKKKADHDGRPHTATPDLDNLIKAFKDATLEQDNFVWHYSTMKKVWGHEGAIIIHDSN